MNEDKCEVTAIIKYDLFPYYVVTKGSLNNDGSIAISSHSYHRAESVIRVLPIETFDEQVEKRRKIANDYDLLHNNLKVQLLNEAKVNYRDIQMKYNK